MIKLLDGDLKQKPFIHELVKNLELALMYSVMLKLKNESNTHTIAHVLVYYSKDLTQIQYDEVLGILKTNWKHMRPGNIINLLESLASRQYKHIFVLNLICNYISYNYKSFDSDEINKPIEELYNYRILNALKKLNFYNGTLVEILVEDILKKINNKQNKKSVIGINCLLASCINLQLHSNKNLIDYFKHNYINDDKIEVTTLNDRINYHDFIFYSAACNYKK